LSGFFVASGFDALGFLILTALFFFADTEEDCFVDLSDDLALFNGAFAPFCALTGDELPTDFLIVLFAGLTFFTLDLEDAEVPFFIETGELTLEKLPALVATFFTGFFFATGFEATAFPLLTEPVGLVLGETLALGADFFTGFFLDKGLDVEPWEAFFFVSTEDLGEDFTDLPDLETGFAVLAATTLVFFCFLMGFFIISRIYNCTKIKYF
jgi:hypothetical protein